MGDINKVSRKFNKTHNQSEDRICLYDKWIAEWYTV